MCVLDVYMKPVKRPSIIQKKMYIYPSNVVSFSGVRHEKRIGSHSCLESVCSVRIGTTCFMYDASV